jgi:hypothetical protein
VTALKPIENRKVIGVPSENYPLGHVCSHPECTNTDVTAHHIFPRSSIKSKSWFVSIDGDSPIPHVVPLCGSGTTGHHGDIEEHRAWIKLEDGEWLWYDRTGIEGIDYEKDAKLEYAFTKVGALNPQPAHGEGKPKRKKKATTSAERKARVNWTVRTPEGEENVIPELVDDARGILKEKMDTDKTPTDYHVITAALITFVRGES